MDDLVWATGEPATEVMRLSKDGVWVNPDIPPEAAAQAVLDALDAQIKRLVQKAVLDEREACADLCEWAASVCGDDMIAWARVWCATAIRARGEA